MKSIESIQDRIDALATKALEEVVEQAEAQDAVKVTDVQVWVGDTPSGQPALDVNVEIRHVAKKG